MKKDEKTNVMRLLEQQSIPFTPHSYPHEEGVAVDGVTVAGLLGRDPDQLFKTLVAVGVSGGHYVFAIPVAAQLDLKKAAKSVGEKSLDMLPLKALTPLTGYVRGGCSPIGMKKQLATVIDQWGELWDTIIVSAGRIGAQVELSPLDLQALTGASFSDVCKE